MHGQHLHEAHGIRLGGSEGGLFPGEVCVVPFPAMVKGIWFDIENGVDGFGVRGGGLAVFDQFPSGENPGFKTPNSKLQAPEKLQASSFKQPQRKLPPPFGRLWGVLVHAVEPAAPLGVYGILMAVRKLTCFRHRQAIDNVARDRKALMKP